MGDVIVLPVIRKESEGLRAQDEARLDVAGAKRRKKLPAALPADVTVKFEDEPGRSE